MRYEGLLWCSHLSASDSCSEPTEHCLHPWTLFLKYCNNIPCTYLRDFIDIYFGSGELAIYMHLCIDVMLHVDKSDGPDFFHFLFYFLYLVLYLVFSFGIVLEFYSRQ